MNDDTPREPNVIEMTPNTGRIATVEPNTGPTLESESDFIARLLGNLRSLNANLREANARGLRTEVQAVAVPPTNAVEVKVKLFRPIEVD